MISTILFDLDGTLLPMDQDAFVRAYIGLLCKALAPHGYDPGQLSAGLMQGIEAMYQNDGSRTNEEAFWLAFTAIVGERARADTPLFDAFYRTEFVGAKVACGFDPRAREIVEALKAMGYRVALATNPLFPAAATHSRIRWAGLEPEDFELVTTYEESTACKPNPAYYLEVAQRLHVSPEECLMVGNDAHEDTAAQMAGMQVFLLTDCLLNRKEADISAWPHGSFDALLDHIKALRA